METRRIIDLPTDDKPREKALRLGVGALSHSELIAIVLGSGMVGKSVIDLSREIIDECSGKLDALSRLSIDEMRRKFKGVGPAKAVSLAAAIELGKRCAGTQGSVMPQIKSAEDVYALLRSDMQHLDHEEFRMLILNRASRVKSVITVSTGGTSATVVDVKMLLKKAIDALADAIIVVHNHPSGTLRPSPQDDTLTRKINSGAQAIDIRMLDHVIISSEGYFSYRDEGRL